MENLSFACQIIVAASVLYIWIFRYDNIVVEFKHYGYSNLVRNFVGASKISISAIMLMVYGLVKFLSMRLYQWLFSCYAHKPLI